MDRAIRAQVDLAVEQSDLVLFLVDGSTGVTPVDQEIAHRLRDSGKSVLLAVNKLDNLTQRDNRFDFYSLGMGEPWPVSAVSGSGTGDLLDELVSRFTPVDETEEPEEIRVAVVGRPNAGKSSLVNRLLGEERHVVTPIAGTTRDAIDSHLSYHGERLTFVDTAGLRRKGRIDEDLEFYSSIRTERAVSRADVAVVVVDAERGVHNQDLRIANHAWDYGLGVIMLINKWDLMAEKGSNTARDFQTDLIRKAPFLEAVPFLFVSALTGQRVRKLLDLVLSVANAREHRVTTSELNEVLQGLLEKAAPPQQAGDEVKLLYASQIRTKPPEIAIVTNRPDDIPVSYQRYLLRGFRKAWNFTGVPIRLKFNRRGGIRSR